MPIFVCKVYMFSLSNEEINSYMIFFFFKFYLGKFQTHSKVEMFIQWAIIYPKPSSSTLPFLEYHKANPKYILYS